ncbi:hypothetical protein NHJ6243_009768 [Beauveria neobassiana]
MAGQQNNRSYVQVGSAGQKRRANPPPQAPSGNRQTPVGLGEDFGQQYGQQTAACEPGPGLNMGQPDKAYGEALHGAQVQHNQQHAEPSYPNTTLDDMRAALMELLEASRALSFVKPSGTGDQGMDARVESMVEMFKANIARKQRARSWNTSSPYGDLTDPGTNPRP